MFVQRCIFLIALLCALEHVKCKQLEEKFKKLIDAEWQCDSICAGSGGTAQFIPEYKICKCWIDSYIDDADLQLMLKNARTMDLKLITVEPITSRQSSRVKKEISSSNLVEGPKKLNTNFKFPTIKPANKFSLDNYKIGEKFTTKPISKGKVFEKANLINSINKSPIAESLNNLKSRLAENKSNINNLKARLAERKDKMKKLLPTTLKSRQSENAGENLLEKLKMKKKKFMEENKDIKSTVAMPNHKLDAGSSEIPTSEITETANVELSNKD